MKLRGQLGPVQRLARRLRKGLLSHISCRAAKVDSGQAARS
jgi:hypothetical protein